MCVKIGSWNSAAIHGEQLSVLKFPIILLLFLKFSFTKVTKMLIYETCIRTADKRYAEEKIIAVIYPTKIVQA